MKSPKHLLAVTAALLIGSASLFAQTTSGGTSTGTTSGGTSTGSTTTSTGTTGGSTTGGSTTGTTSTGTSSTGRDHGKAAPHTPNPNSSATAQAVQKVLQQFDAQRDQLMADRKALLDKLAAAKTDAEKQAILAELKAAQQDRAQLGKEIRDEMKKAREQRKTGGG